MRITEKGQVTIPKEIRDRLSIGPGSEVDFVVNDDQVTLVKSSRRDDFKDFKAWADSVEGLFDTMGMSTDAYVEWLRGPRDDLDGGWYQCADRCSGTEDALAALVPCSA